MHPSAGFPCPDSSRLKMNGTCKTAEYGIQVGYKMLLFSFLGEHRVPS